MRRVRIGVVGAGGVAARHVEVLSGLPGVAVAGVADVDAGRGRALAARCGAEAFAGVDALLAGVRGLDAVYVCVPPFAHGPPERAVLAAGLPLFVEKPLGADLATAEALAEEVAAAGVPTATGYHWRGLSTLPRALEKLAGRPPRLALAAWLDKVPPVGWWTARALSGGQVVEQVTHVLDLLRMLVGEVAWVSAAGVRAPEGEEHVDVATSATLRFASGAVGSLAATSLLGAKRRAGIELVADGVALALTEEELVLEGGEVVRSDPWAARRRVDEDFVAAVRGEPGRVLAPYAEALETHRLGCALAASAAAGEPVELGGG